MYLESEESKVYYNCCGEEANKGAPVNFAVPSYLFKASAWILDFEELHNQVGTGFIEIALLWL